MKKHFTVSPKLSSRRVTASTRQRVLGSIASLSEDNWKHIADMLMTAEMESDADAGFYNINNPEQAAVAGINKLKRIYEDFEYSGRVDEDGELEYYGLPENLVVDKQLASQLKPLFVDVASGYYFGDTGYDSDFEDW